MSSKFFRSVGMLIVVLVFSGCEFQAAEKDADIELLSGPFQQKELKFIFAGQRPTQALANRGALQSALAQFRVPRQGDTFGDWIQRIKAANLPVLTGLGGVPARAFLAAAEESLRDGDFVFPVVVDVHGRIERECNGQSGYYYDAYQGSGRLCVTVIATMSKTVDGQEVTIQRAERYLVTVGIGGFRVEARTNPTNTPYGSTVFPDFTDASHLAISAETATGDDGQRYDKKLWATGTKIRVDGLWLNSRYHEDPTAFEEIVPGHDDYEYYEAAFVPDPDACIDMMFLEGVNVPIGTMPADYDPPKYCLGRCDNPPIINTR